MVSTRVKNPELWIETDNAIGPHLADLAKSGAEVVRVLRQAAPFALGEVIAFFVGEDAWENAARFVGCDPADPDSHDWQRRGENHTTDGRTIYYACSRCGAEDSS